MAATFLYSLESACPICSPNLNDSFFFGGDDAFHPPNIYRQLHQVSLLPDVYRADTDDSSSFVSGRTSPASVLSNTNGSGSGSSIFSCQSTSTSSAHSTHSRKLWTRIPRLKAVSSRSDGSRSPPGKG